jgi:prepilin-type N-terminal cleavage/methylation domain-containing protein/prepilin-type processing-associated H-X9-DG protein
MPYVVPSHNGAGASRRRTAGRPGFTLVELLVVIGIIAVLLSILLPALGRVREKGNQLKCLSNIRQLGIATLMYCNDNRGLLPGGAVGGNPKPWDWVYWKSGLAAPYDDPANCPLARYYSGGSRPVAEILVCPSDNVETRSYKFSFSINAFICDDSRAYAHLNNGVTKRFSINMVKNPSEKVLFGEEDERTINDGLWHVKNTINDRLGVRHDQRRTVADNSGRGNVLFCDGHAEFTDRSVAHDPKHYYPDY